MGDEPADVAEHPRDDEIAVLECINLTCMEKNKHTLWSRKADVVCFQEAKIHETKMAAMVEEFKLNGWTLEGGPCDDSTTQP